MQRVLPQEKIDLIRRTIFKDASNDQLIRFLHICQHRELDPFANEVYGLLYHNDDSRAGKGEKTMVIVVGIDGYRKMAARDHNDFAGTSAAEFTWFEPDKRTPRANARMPESATVWAFRKGGIKTSATAYWEEYAPADLTDRRADFWRRYPKVMLEKCFADDTEVLTDNGFRRFQDIQDEMILQVTDQGLETVNAKPFSQYYDGPMVTLNSQALNFSVTPDHDMLLINGNKMEAFTLYETSTSEAKERIPLVLKTAQSLSDAPIPDQAFRLAGAAIADATVGPYKQFRISVSRKRKVKKLKLWGGYDSIGIRHCAGDEAASSTGRVIVTKTDRLVFAYRKELLCDLLGDGKIPNISLLLRCSARQIAMLVDAWLEFDGSVTTAGTRRLTAKRQDLLRCFETLAVAAHYTVAPPKLRVSDIGSAYTVTVSTKQNAPVQREYVKRNGTTVSGLEVTHYRGFVWCVRVPSHCIIVRRHGLSMLCGQCAEAKALRKAFPNLGIFHIREELAQREEEQTESGREITDTKGFTMHGTPVTPQARFQLGRERAQAVAEQKIDNLTSGAEHAASKIDERRAKEKPRPEAEKPAIDVQPAAAAKEPRIVELDLTDPKDPIIRGEIGEIVDVLQKYVAMEWRKDWWHFQPAQMDTIIAFLDHCNEKIGDGRPFKVRRIHNSPATPRGDKEPPTTKRAAGGESKRGTSTAEPTLVKGILIRCNASSAREGKTPTRQCKIDSVFYICFRTTLFPFLDQGIGKHVEVFLDKRHQIVGLKSVGTTTFDSDGATPFVDNRTREAGTKTLFNQ